VVVDEKFSFLGAKVGDTSAEFNDSLDGIGKCKDSGRKTGETTSPTRFADSGDFTQSFTVKSPSFVEAIDICNDRVDGIDVDDGINDGDDGIDDGIDGIDDVDSGIDVDRCTVVVDCCDVVVDCCDVVDCCISGVDC
jgi:hypothetical protein